MLHHEMLHHIAVIATGIIATAALLGALYATTERAASAWHANAPRSIGKSKFLIYALAIPWCLILLWLRAVW